MTINCFSLESASIVNKDAEIMKCNSILTTHLYTDAFTYRVSDRVIHLKYRKNLVNVLH